MLKVATLTMYFLQILNILDFFNVFFIEVLSTKESILENDLYFK